VLAEPARRALYRYVVSQAEPVSRDQAAADADLSRHTAKFHQVGRRGAARDRVPAPVRTPRPRHGPSDEAVPALRPPTHGHAARAALRLAGHIIARPSRTRPATASPCWTRSGGQPPMRAASSAHNPGRRRGNVSKEGARAVQAVTDAPAERGYEPRLQEGTLVLVNCPSPRCSTNSGIPSWRPSSTRHPGDVA
jgi:hypothetical protein